MTSSSGYLSDLFILGYDPARLNLFGNPRHRKSHEKTIRRRPVLEANLLRVCRVPHTERTVEGKAIEPKTDCQQPQSRSRFIDSLNDFQKWIREQVDVDQESSDNVMSVTIDDPEQLSIQADLIAGHRIVVTQLSCPIFDVSPQSSPKLEPKFIQQLKLALDEETALETIEDFGTTYVDRAVLGHSVIIRFTLNATGAERLTRKNQSLAQDSALLNSATTAGLWLLSLSNLTAVNLSPSEQETGRDFMAAAMGGGRLYANSMIDSVEANSAESLPHKWMRKAFQKPSSIISLRLKPLEHLFGTHPQLNESKGIEMWRRGTLGFEKISDSATFMLPLLSLWTNTSTFLRTPNIRKCLELCRSDALCSASTFCATSKCPEQFGSSFNCALHRQQEYYPNQSNVSKQAMTVLTDKTVILKGFRIQGNPIYSTNQVFTFFFRLFKIRTIVLK